jgi:hypothetical protein
MKKIRQASLAGPGWSVVMLQLDATVSEQLPVKPIRSQFLEDDEAFA